MTHYLFTLLEEAIVAPPRIGPDDTARTRLTDPVTSHAAADSNTNRDMVEAFVFALFMEHSNLTDHELTVKYFAAENHPEADMDSPRKRRSDLTNKGVVVATLEKRPSRTGRAATVWTMA